MRFLALLVALLVTSSLACAGSPVPGPAPPETGTARHEQELAGSEDEAEDSKEDEVPEFDHAHELFDKLLRKHVAVGFLDYKGVIGERKKLGRYIRRLRKVTPAQMESWTREQRYAFWINVYNAHVIRLVIDNYPVKSIRDIGGAVFNRVWDKEFIELSAFHPDGDGDLLSLNDVEHGILRPQFQDARVHAAVNCASISCPEIMGEAFVAERLEEQLERQMRLFVNDRRRNSIDPLNSQLQVSEIFKWFEDDFVRDRGSVRDYLIHYSPESAAEFLRQGKIRYVKYDWNLNDIEANRL